MKKAISILCVIMFCFFLTACDNSGTKESKQSGQQETAKNIVVQHTDNINASLGVLTMIELSIMVGDKAFSAKLYDNQTIQELVKKFPMTVEMSELNGNEKYYYLSDHFPVNSEHPGEIHVGDIMLYGDNCLVMFYKTFSSSYKYTRLGYIEDASGFAQAVGDGNIKVTINLSKYGKFRGNKGNW